MRVHVRFFRDSGLYAWLIRAWTRCDYNHCDVAWITPLKGAAVVYSALSDRGVTTFPAHTPDLDALEIPIELPDGTKALSFAISEIGCGYDWKGIALAQVIALHREDPEKWFCSEYVAAILRAGGLPVLERNCDYSPADVLRLAQMIAKGQAVRGPVVP